MSKKLTRLELTEKIEQLERTIARHERTIQILDAGLFTAVYSLLKEEKIYIPEFIKTTDDIKKAGVSEVLSATVRIMQAVMSREGDNANKN